MKRCLKTILLILAPLVLIAGGGWLMRSCTDRTIVEAQLEKAQNEKDQAPLYLRYQGYTADEVGAHWGLLNSSGLKKEKQFLQADLFYPLYYGAVFLIAFLVARSGSDRPCSCSWLVAPVVILVLADWTENLIQLDQLDRYIASGLSALESGWIQIASYATMAKLALFVGAVLMLVCLALSRLARAR